jgi:hypothetical protein
MIAAVLQVFAQEAVVPTVEWMNSPEAAEAALTPVTRWLSDNRAFIYEMRKPAADRAIELLDPKTGSRTLLLDQKSARSSLAKVLGDDSTPTYLPYPEEVDGKGKTALYILKGDVYLLDLPSLTFLRVTQTPESESCVRLSPDGKRVAYVRGLLFAYDQDENRRSSRRQL